MGKLPGDERPLVGQRANVLKEQVQTLMADRLAAVKGAAMAKRIAAETLRRFWTMLAHQQSALLNAANFARALEKCFFLVYWSDTV